jgi:hypothetical protein
LRLSSACRRAFEYRGDFGVSLGMSLPQPAAFGIQYQLKPSLEILLISDDETVLG